MSSSLARSSAHQSPVAPRDLLPPVVSIGSTMLAKNVFIWNIRGLNMRARREIVREFWSQERASVLCLVETKLAVMSQAMAYDLMGPNFDYVLVPSDGASGGSFLPGTRTFGRPQIMWYASSLSRHG